tara:strand:+ start:2305 stop:2907 length:603 start_codon:yes stop_codon:yes gene_type:complete
MAKKISELPSTTTPPSTVEIAVVDSGVTKKTTAREIANSFMGWFDVGHGGADQTGLGTAQTKVLNDASSVNQGGYSYLPTGISAGDVYNATDSQIKTDWLEVGQMILLRVTGEVTSSSTNTGATISFRFYDADDVFIFSLDQFAVFIKPTTTTAAFSVVEPVFISSSVAATGAYCEVHMTFDSGTSNEINMGGFTLTVLR